MLDPIQPMAAALNPIRLDWPGIQNSGQTFQQFSREQIIHVIITNIKRHLKFRNGIIMISLHTIRSVMTIES